MDTVSDDRLFIALRDSGLLTAEMVAAAERAFTDRRGDPRGLAEQLNAAGCLTRYQFKKLQAGRVADLQFGAYLILDKIGEGGMGKVYRAVQLRTARMVALKVVRPQLMSNKTVVKRYEREAAAAARLDHPNIVKLHDAELADGRYFLAMEYIEGLDLSRLVKQFGPLPYQEACEYVRQAALGLAHAHRLSLIHRDIKPSNLLVSGERALPGTNGQAALKILDMGLVRSLLDADADQPDLTRDGTVVGTPDYMSPEQAKNSSQVTPQADVYSLGCTLYYLLTAKPPFPDGSPVEKLIKHQLDPFPDVRQLVPSVPAGLVRVLADMTAKRTSDRTPTADAVAFAVAPYTPNGDQFDLFAPTAGTPAARYESVDFAPTTTSPRAVKPVAEAAATPTPTATRTGGRVPGPRSGRIARPKAIPLPEPEPISAESLPAGEARKTPRSTRTTPRRKLIRKAKKKPFPVVAVVGCVVVAVLALALVLLLFHRPSAPTPTPDETPKPTPTPPPSQPLSPFRPLADLHPEKTTAVLFGHPKAYFEAVEREAKPWAPLPRTLDRLYRRFLFDPRKLDRVTVAFTSDPKGYVAIGEGGYLKPEWVADLDKYPTAVTVKADAGGVTRLTFPLPSPPKRLLTTVYSDARGAVLMDPTALVLTDHDAPLDWVVRRNSDPAAGRAPAADLPPALSHALRAAADRTPLLSFAADGKFRLPAKTAWAKGDTLATLGVSLLTMEARLDKQFTVDVAVTGDTLEHVRDFLNVELPRRLKDWSPALKPFAEAAVAVAPLPDPASSRPRMTLSVSLDWDTVKTAVETLLAPHANDR